MASRERVVINIEVNSDIATIEATRAALERLSGAESDSDRTVKRSTKTRDDHSASLRAATKHSDDLADATHRAGRAARGARGRWDGFGKALFSFRRDAGMAIGLFGKLIGVVNKLSLIEIPLLAAGLAGIALLFKSGTPFINMFRAAMSSMAYVAAGVGVAITTIAAAMREFQSVQFAPMYSEGGGNTTDRFVAASQAMKMFVDNANLAVAGSESLQKAFGVLSKQAPVTGGTVAAFEGLMNVVAGSGGDIGGGAQKLAEFIAKVQKSGLGAAGSEAKALGSDFEKIMKEAKELGITTQEEFFKAAAEGNLGETFQTKYAGQLEAVNSTLIGTFKRSFAGIKSIFIDVGQQFLGPARDAVFELELIVKRTVMQLSPMLAEFGQQRFFDNVISFADKAANKFVYLMTKYLNTAPGLIEYFGNVIDKIGGFFERIQDWARQFEDAGQVLIDNFFGPVFQGIIDKFGGGMNVLSDLVEANAPMLKSLADTLVELIAAIGDYGNMLKKAFIAAIPAINQVLKGVTQVFKIFTKIANGLLTIFGKGGNSTKVLAAVPVLYASLVLFSRFFSTLGSFFGKDMSIKANNVHVYGPGSGMGMGPLGSGPFPRANRFLSGEGGRISRVFGKATKAVGLSPKLTYGTAGMMMGGQALNMMGGQVGGYGGQALSGAGNALTAYGVGRTLGLGAKASAGLAVPVLAYTATTMLSDAIQDMPGFKGKFANKDAVGQLGMAAAGAGAGAAIGGAMFSFTGPGAAVAAVVGGIVGGITGYFQAGKHQDAAEDAARALSKSFAEASEEAFAAGDLEGLTKARSDLIAAHKKNMETLVDTATYQKELGNFDKMLADFDKRLKTYSSNAALAERYLGMSTDALNALAESAGINVQTELLSLRDIIGMTGRTAADQARLIKAAWSEINGAMVGGVLGDIQNIKQQKQLGYELSAMQNKVLGGAQTEDDLLNLVESQLKFSTAQFGEQGGLVNAFNTLTDPKAFLEGGALAGLGPEAQTKLAELVQMLNPQTALMKYVTPEQLGLLRNEVGFKGLDDIGIRNKLIEELGKDNMYLYNLQNAMATGSDFAVGQVTGGYVPTGPAVPTGVKGDKYTPNPVSQVNSNNTNNYTVQMPSGAILTPQTLKMIEDHFADMDRRNKERGGM